MIKVISILSFLVLTTALAVRAQVPPDKETMKLYDIIIEFIDNRDDYYEGRKSEVIVMILEMDSTGAVNDIHLLADNNNIDSSYVILKKMKPADFGDTKFISWKNKVLNLTIYTISDLEIDKRKRYSSSYVANSTISISSTIQMRQAVMLPSLCYYTPVKPPDERRATGTFILDTKNEN
jgi:hypothetical protein